MSDDKVCVFAVLLKMSGSALKSRSVYSCTCVVLVYREKGDTGAKKKKKKQKKKKDKSGGKDSAQDPLAKVRKPFLSSVCILDLCHVFFFLDMFSLLYNEVCVCVFFFICSLSVSFHSSAP